MKIKIQLPHSMKKPHPAPTMRLTRSKLPSFNAFSPYCISLQSFVVYGGSTLILFSTKIDSPSQKTSLQALRSLSKTA